jgi:hypothetical protein
LHIKFTWLKKEKKNDPTIETGKIWIPFIKLGIKPTSTLGPKRDQLVNPKVLELEKMCQTQTMGSKLQKIKLKPTLRKPTKKNKC